MAIENKPTTDDAPPDPEPNRLAHPVDAEQIDIQDTKTAWEELRPSQQFVERVMQSSPSTVYVLDIRRQTTLYLNREPEQDLGYTLEELQALPPQLHPDDLARVPEFMARWDTADDADVLENEIRVRHRNGEYRWRLVRETVFERDAAGAVTKIIGAGVDITDRKRAEERVRASEELTRAVAANLPSAAAFVVDHDLRYILAAGEALEAAGFTPSALEGKTVAAALPPELVPVYTANYRRALGGEAFRTEHASHGRYYVTHGTPLRDVGGRVVAALAVSYDITERVTAERALAQAHDRLEQRVRERTADLEAAVAALEAESGRRRRLTRQLATIQEDERRRVARDLHDSIGQLLTGLALAIKAAETTANVPIAAAERLVEVRRLAAVVGREVHDLAVRMRPTALDDIGLVAAVEQLVGEWAARGGVLAEFHAEGLAAERLPAEVETTLYRVVQEGLTNVARHARAARVSVVLSRQGGTATAVVEDDGVGFDPALNSGRFGLVGMRERVELVGGELEIETSPGAGTTIAVRIPVATGDER